MHRTAHRHRTALRARLIRTTVVALAAAGLLASAQLPGQRGESEFTQVASVSCAPGVWKAQYFANTRLSGTPRKTVCDTAIKENWRGGHPAVSGLRNDDFGVRWTTRRDFGGGGPFTLSVTGQDGVRVWVDSRLYVNQWRDYPRDQRRVLRVSIPAGTHSLRVDYAAFRGAADIAVGLTPATPDRVRPLAPTGLRAVAQDSAAQLGWARNAEADLAGYRVYRSTTASVPLDAAHRVSGSALLRGTSFANSRLRNGTRYWFAVTAVDRSGNESRSVSASTVPADTRAPAPATWLTVTPYEFDEQMYMDWAPSVDDPVVTDGGDVVGYDIDRALSANGPWTRVSTRHPQTPGFTDTTAPLDVLTWYRVMAVDEAGNHSKPLVGAATLRDTGLRTPPMPGPITAGIVPGRLTLDWPDNPVGSGTAGYRVESWSSFSNSWIIQEDNGDPLFRTSSISRYSDGGQYTFRVAAVGKTPTDGSAPKVSGYRSISVTMPEPPDTTPPNGVPQPRAAATGMDTAATISWTYTGRQGFENDLAGYVAYRSASASGPWEKVSGTLTSQCNDIDPTSCWITGVPTGPVDPPDVAEPYFKVVSIDTSGNESALGMALAAQLVRTDSRPPAAPTGLTATIGAGGAVVLGWNASTEPDLPYYPYLIEYQTPGTANWQNLEGFLQGTTLTVPGMGSGTAFRLCVYDRFGNRSEAVIFPDPTA